MQEGTSHVPECDACCYTDIQGVLGTKLWDLQAMIYLLHHLFLYAVYFVPKHQRIALVWLGDKCIQLQTIMHLLQGKYLVALST